jgi:hypothetical protein
LWMVAWQLQARARKAVHGEPSDVRRQDPGVPCHSSLADLSHACFSMSRCMKLSGGCQVPQCS